MAFREDFLKSAREGVTAEYSRKDLHIMQAVRSLDDIDEAKSLLFTRLSEWFKLNFPEMDFANEETYCEIVAQFGSKEHITKEKLYELVGEHKGGEIFAASKKSYGAPLLEDDEAAVKALATRTLGLFHARKALEEYVTEASNELMPNLSHLLEPTIAARLVTCAGGLEKLAVMPASTIQVLGAESALFKHLRSGSQPPKHGIIFQSAYIRGEPLERRGRIARALAAKLAIAAKADFFSHNFIAEKLKADLDSRVKEVDELKLAPRRELTPDEEFKRDFGHERRERGFRKAGDARTGGKKFGGQPYNKFRSRPSFGGERSYGDRPRYGSRPNFGGNRRFGGKTRFAKKAPFGGKRRHR